MSGKWILREQAGFNRIKDGDREALVMVRILRNIPDAVTLRVDRFPVKPNNSVLWLQQSEHEFEQSRLSPAVWADYRYELALIHLGGNSFNDRLLIVAEGDVPEFYTHS
jgi:hypothetical protein